MLNITNIKNIKSYFSVNNLFSYFTCMFVNQELDKNKIGRKFYGGLRHHPLS